MLLLHGTLLIYAVVSVFAKLAGLRLAAQDAGMTLAFLAAEAAALLAEARAYARKNEMTRICLEVRASNAAARSLYEDFGFEEDGVRPGFYDSPKEDAVLYSLYI